MKINRWIIAVSLSVTFLAGGCFNQQDTPPPVDLDIKQAIARLYTTAGSAIEIKNQQMIGKHYRSSMDSWKLIVCTKLVISGGNEINDCNDSFELLQLDSKKWIVNGTINGSYRWTELQPVDKTAE